MPSTSDSSDSATHASPGAEPRRYCPGKVPGAKAATAKDVSPAAAIIVEHKVALGTATRTRIAPSLNSELDGEDAMQEGAVPSRTGWIATLARLVTPSRDRRPQCPQHPGHLHSDYLAGARMAREMRRL